MTCILQNKKYFDVPATFRPNIGQKYIQKFFFTFFSLPVQLLARFHHNHAPHVQTISGGGGAKTPYWSPKTPGGFVHNYITARDRWGQAKY